MQESEKTLAVHSLAFPPFLIHIPSVFLTLAEQQEMLPVTGMNDSRRWETHARRPGVLFFSNVETVVWLHFKQDFISHKCSSSQISFLLSALYFSR